VDVLDERGQGERAICRTTNPVAQDVGFLSVNLDVTPRVRIMYRVILRTNVPRVVYAVHFAAFTRVKPTHPAIHVLGVVIAPLELACGSLDETCLVTLFQADLEIAGETAREALVYEESPLAEA
jgi:hypothetical protein